LIFSSYWSANKSLSVEDSGERVALVPTHQRFDAALGESAMKAGLAKIGAVENGLHLLIAYEVGDRVHFGVA
jgi:hypothetical protein